MPLLRLLLPLLAMLAMLAMQTHAHAAAAASPLTIGDTFLIDSAVLGEQRRINVYVPRGQAPGQALPVLYMPDGGLDEDFLHVAGLLQVGNGNGTTRPFLLVGIENTERRRDLTGPTTSAKDRAIAPRVGASQRFRQFLRTELMPHIASRYRVTNERAIVGESLAGLFVVETLLLEPDLFDTYIAIDPSLWWNHGALARQLSAAPPTFNNKALYIATSSDAGLVIDGADADGAFARSAGLHYRHRTWLEETHATVYHPAALAAFRDMLRPVPRPPAALGQTSKGQTVKPAERIRAEQ
jgi:predicted alpha/beta superfamily hydrolase